MIRGVLHLCFDCRTYEGKLSKTRPSNESRARNRRMLASGLLSFPVMLRTLKNPWRPRHYLQYSIGTVFSQLEKLVHIKVFNLMSIGNCRCSLAMTSSQLPRVNLRSLLSNIGPAKHTPNNGKFPQLKPATLQT